MPIVTRYYTFNRRDLPVKSDELRVRFVPQLVNGKNTLLVLYQNSESDLHQDRESSLEYIIKFSRK